MRLLVHDRAIGIGGALVEEHLCSRSVATFSFVGLAVALAEGLRFRLAGFYVASEPFDSERLSVIIFVTQC